MVVVLNDPQDWAALPARLVPDIYADGGALGGIYATCWRRRTTTRWRWPAICPSSTPRLSAPCLARPRDYDVLVPRSLHPGGTRNALGIESLHAIYSRACLGPMRAMLEGGQRQIAALIAQMRVAYIEAEETRRYDPDGRSFVNINTAEQLAEAWRQTTHH